MAVWPTQATLIRLLNGHDQQQLTVLPNPKTLILPPTAVPPAAPPQSSLHFSMPCRNCSTRMLHSCYTPAPLLLFLYSSPAPLFGHERWPYF